METINKFKVFPTQYVKGFCPSFCRTMEGAMAYRAQMEKVTRVEWRVRRVA